MTEYAHATSKEDVDGANQAQTNDNSDATQNENGNVDKIRDILFGGHMRDYDRRFSRLEDRIARESLNLREATKNSLEALEAYVKNEFQALGSRLQAEQKTREGSIENVTRELHEAARNLDCKLAQFNTETTHAQSELRQQLLDQSKTLSEEIRRRSDEVTAIVEREVNELNHGKTDRAGLSALFTELAMRLNNDFNMPDQS